MLAAGARDGDLEAYALLVEGSWTRLVRLARSIVGDADAEDVTQEALLAAWRRIGSLRRPESVDAWLTRITVRRCLAHARRRPSHEPLEAAGDPWYRTDPGAGIDVERMLSALAPRQRAVMHLTVMEGLTDREIARAMGLRPASVRAHRRRAREKLERMLRGDAS